MIEKNQVSLVAHPNSDEIASPVFDAWREADCFEVKTAVEDSTIKEAGRGRFIKESIAPETLLRKCPVYFDYYDPKKHNNCVVALKSVEAIETYMKFEDILGRPKNWEQINNFAGIPFNILAYSELEYVYWFQPPCYLNHNSGQKANVYLDISQENDRVYLLIKALRHIEAGEEIMIDYRNFDLPQWFKDYVHTQKLIATEELGISQSGVPIDDTYTIKIYKTEHEGYKSFINNFYRQHEQKGNDFAIAAFMEKLPAGGTVLDLGCCTGWHAYQFHKAGFSVTAMDTSEKFIAELDPEINPIVGGFESLDFEETFDGFVLSWVFHHLQREGIDLALAKIFRALKADGWLYLSTVEADKDYRDSMGRLYVTFTEEELTQRLEDYGFSVQYVEKHQFNNYDNMPITGLVIHAQRRSS